MFWKDAAIYREHPCQSMVTIKVLCNFTKIALRHGCSPVTLLHIFRTPFYKTPVEDCYCYFENAGYLLLNLFKCSGASTVNYPTAQNNLNCITFNSLFNKFVTWEIHWFDVSHILLQSQQRTIVWNMSNISNKDTRTTSLTIYSMYCLHSKFQIILLTMYSFKGTLMQIWKFHYIFGCT